jgi:hypothetical protein
MASTKLKLFDVYVLKVLWVFYILLFIRYFYLKAWFLGGFLVFAWFIIGVIGQSLYPEKSSPDLAKGIPFPTKKELEEEAKSDLSHYDANKIGQATVKLSILIGVTALAIAWYHGIRWYFSFLIGIAAGYLYIPISGIYLMLVYKIKYKV